MVSDQANCCPKCGHPLLPPKSAENKDKISFWEIFLSFIFPFIGLILWGAYKANYPQKSEDCLTVAMISAIISFGIWLTLSCILSLF